MSQQSIRAITKQIEKLQAKVVALQAKSKKPVIRAIVKMMLENDVSMEEIGTMLEQEKARGSSDPKPVKPRKPVAIKYRNPATNENWTGQGRTPRWIVEAEASRKDRKEFAV